VTRLKRPFLAASLVALVAIGVPFTCAAVAAAQEHHGASTEHAEHHEAGDHAPALGDLFWPAINFTIYLVIVVVFVIPAMREYLRRRRAEVVQLEAESGAALTRAQADLAASKARLASLESEAEGIRQDLVAIANRQAERVKSQAEETGTRRLADASLLAEQERRRAFEGLRADLAGAAANLAEARIRGVLTAEDQRTFVHRFLKDASSR
jgi:F0F1-type ATP synthase membrane subunit b/b'